MISAEFDALFLTNAGSLSSELGSIQNWVKYRLGAPVLTVELVDEQINAFAEESIMVYSSEIAKFKAKNSYLSSIGIKKNVNMEQKSPMPSLNFIKRYVAQFATDANAGGVVNYNKGYVDMVSGQTHYNLLTDLKDQSTGNTISLTGAFIPKVIYHSSQTPKNRYMDPAYGTNFLLYNEFGGKDAYAMQSKMLYSMPLYEHLLRFTWFANFNAIFKSKYKWNIIGTDLTLSPVPSTGVKLFIDWIDSVTLDNTFGDYLSQIDESSLSAFTTGITDIPYNNLTYSLLNDFSKNWIKQYTLALCKESLGLIRSKFLNVPIPDNEVTLNYSELLIEGKEQQSGLKDELREFLNSIVSSEALKRESDILDVSEKYLKLTPISKIYKM